jgi:hypothetical protein
LPSTSRPEGRSSLDSLEVNKEAVLQPGLSDFSSLTHHILILRGQLSDPTPEERLWLAVIEQAVREAYGAVQGEPGPSEEARKWLDSEEFEEVALALGLHPRWARDTIRKLEGIDEDFAGAGAPSSQAA